MNEQQTRDYRLVRVGAEIRVDVDGKRTSLHYPANRNLSDLRFFVKGSGLSDTEVDEKLDELFSAEAQTGWHGL